MNAGTCNILTPVSSHLCYPGLLIEENVRPVPDNRFLAPLSTVHQNCGIQHRVLLCVTDRILGNTNMYGLYINVYSVTQGHYVLINQTKLTLTETHFEL